MDKSSASVANQWSESQPRRYAASRSGSSLAASVDEHLADQLVLPCALAGSESRWTTPEITEHLRTVLFVTQQFLPITYKLSENADGSGLVTLSSNGLNPIAQ